jgi:hypothetical protein
MLRALPERRPNCEEILKQKYLWALNEEFEINDELREEYVSKINDENQSIFSVLKSKLKILNKLLESILLVESTNQWRDYLKISKVQ